VPPGPRHAPDTPPTRPRHSRAPFPCSRHSEARGLPSTRPTHARHETHNENFVVDATATPTRPDTRPTHARHIPRRTLHSKIATGFPDTPPTQTRHKPDASPTHSKYVNVVVRAFACRVYTDPISVYTVSPPAPVSTPCLQNGTSTTCLDGLFSRCVYVSGAPIQLQSGLLEALRLRRVSEISSVTQWPQN
jgi:hypothetical protein